MLPTIITARSTAVAGRLLPILLVAALIPTATATTINVDGSASCDSFSYDFTEYGDPAHREGDACTRRADVTTDQGAAAGAHATDGSDATTYEDRHGAYSGSYTAERVSVGAYADTAASGLQQASLELVRERGHIDLREDGTLDYREIRLAGSAGPLSERAVFFTMTHDEGDRCGIAYSDPIDPESQHGVSFPLGEGCRVLP